MSSSENSPRSGATEHLRATFGIEPHPEAGCSIVGASTDGSEVTQELVLPDDSRSNGSECRTEVVDPESNDRRYLNGVVHERCVCPVFQCHDCITSVEKYENGVLEVSVTTPDREELSAIVSALQATGATVRLRRISRSGGDIDAGPVELEVDSITEKQREAVFLAVEMGYYETPRRADLTDLAESLEVSRSAVSQRLTAIESKLVTNLFEQHPSESASIAQQD